MLMKILLFVSYYVCFVSCGCREQQRNVCEAICQQSLDGNMKCELRGAIILPISPAIEASLPRVLPVIEMAERKIRAEKILPEYLNISWAKYDDECDAAIATISAIDAYAKNCSHFILGPSCEYSVASVGRIAKYFYHDGLNIITAGGFSFDFEEPKTSCEHQFHMLHRVGTLSFERIAKFSLNLMQNFHWEHAALVYERNGYLKVGGIQTCHLMMSSMAKILNEGNVKFSSHIMDFANSNIREDLMRKVGKEHSSK